MIGVRLVCKETAKDVFNVVTVLEKVPFLIALLFSFFVPFLFGFEGLYLLELHFVKQFLHVSEMSEFDL